MKKVLMTLLACVVMTSAAIAQQVEVRGTVISGTSGDPLIGVAVFEDGTQNGTTTNLDGEFTIRAKEGAKVIFSCIGYKTLEIVLGTKTNLQIELFEDTEALEEVVVVGYGTMKKSDLTGSVSSVKADKLKSVVITNADQMLQGRVAGVQVTQNSGAPGGAASIRVRGASSISNSNEPLYVVDGIPFSGDGAGTIGFDWAGGSSGQTKVNPLSTISPQDIISIDVLKDASATAIYGSAGANGVVIINTRQGQEGKLTLSYDGQVTLQTLAKKLDMMNLTEFSQYRLNMEDRYPGIGLDDIYSDPSILGPGNDWEDAIFRDALMHSHSLSMSGGNEKSTYAASIGYTNQEGTVVGSSFERYNGRFSVNGKVKSWLEAGGSLAFTNTDELITRQDGVDGVIMQALTMSPSVPVYNFDGTFAGPESVYGSSAYNPLWLAECQNNTVARSRIMGNFHLQANIIKGLNIRSEFGYDATNTSNKSFIPTYDFGGGVSSNMNIMRQSEGKNNFWIWKNYATFNRTIAKKHSLNAMVGFEMQRSAWEGIVLQKSGFSTNDIHVMTEDGEFGSNSGYKDAASKVSAFARLNYSYDDRYLVTGTIRGDASSKFGANNRWGYFPSGAFAWKINNEEFLKSVDSISELKLRLGYGMVGNDNIPNYAYGSTMTTALSALGGSSYRVSNISNPNLKWEASEQYNIGIDGSFFDQRLSFTLDFYQKDTKDLLMQVAVPSYLGVGHNNGFNIGAPIVNIGAVQNKGFDLSINAFPVSTKNFVWSSNLVLSRNINKVVALNDDAQVITSGLDWQFNGKFKNASLIKVGKPIGVFYGYKTDGYFQNEEDVLSAPVQVEDDTNLGQNLFNEAKGVYVGDIKFKDLNKDGVIDDKDQTIIGDPNPDLTFGWTNNFTYKQFDLSIGLNGVIGGDILNVARSQRESLSSAWDNQSRNALHSAKVGFDEFGDAYLANPESVLTPRIALNDINNNTRMSDRWIEDGTYLRIQNITLSYSLKKEHAQLVGLQNLKVYGTVQNVYTFTNYSGYDPEIGAFNQSASMSNYDIGRYPTPRMFIFGLNIGF